MIRFRSRWPLTAALVCCIAAAGCISGADNRGESDTADDSCTGACATCRIDLDCPSPDACTVGRCDDGVCTTEARTCDDGNDCTDDTCAPTVGCQYSTRRAGSTCAHGDGSNRCAGDVYHLQDWCDGQGHCTESGTTDCALGGAGPCWRSGCLVSDVGGGCEYLPRADGLACSADGLSGECHDGRLHATDRCSFGECVEAGSTACPAGFCERASCDADGGCATEPIGVERAMPGNWMLFEMYQGDGGLATVQAGFAFDGDHRVTTYGALTSQPEDAPGDGDYCLSNDGDLRFALPFGAVAPAPHTLYRGVLASSDDVALVFREGAPSTGVLVALPTGEAPTLSGDYRVLGLMRRNVIGVRALLGTVSFDARGCTTGGAIRSSDEFEALAVPSGASSSTFAWLVGFELGLDKERYPMRGTVLRGGDLAVFTRHTDTATVGDALVFLVRQQSPEAATMSGHDAWSRLDLVAGAAGVALVSGRGTAEVAPGGDYVTYEELTLDGQRFASSTMNDFGVFSGGLPGAYSEFSPDLVAGQRPRAGQFATSTATSIGLLLDVAADVGSADESTSPRGISLRIGVRRP